MSVALAISHIVALGLLAVFVLPILDAVAKALQAYANHRNALAEVVMEHNFQPTPGGVTLRVVDPEDAS